MNLKSEDRRSRSQFGLDFISVSSRRRSISLDIPFHRTPLPEMCFLGVGVALVRMILPRCGTVLGHDCSSLILVSFCGRFA